MTDNYIRWPGVLERACWKHDVPRHWIEPIWRDWIERYGERRATKYAVARIRNIREQADRRLDHGTGATRESTYWRDE